jgi:acetyltransferase-like isoleucine patch superfamily enzyme
MVGLIAGIRTLSRLLLEPVRLLALLRGQWYRLYYPLRGTRVQVGARVHAYGRLRIRDGAEVVLGNRLTLHGTLLIQGPGEVVIRDRVIITEGLRILGPGKVTLENQVTVLEGSILRTKNRQARIVIGDRTMLRDVDADCVREILIGRDCMVAPAMIMDSDFHSIRADRHSPDSLVRVSSVRVADNVWIAARAALLPGTRIGKNSVVSFGAVCTRAFPENVVIIGYPARVAAPIPSVPDNELPEQYTEVLESLYVPLRELRSRQIPW